MIDDVMLVLFIVVYGMIIAILAWIVLGLVWQIVSMV
jgi:hypothetical protein